MAAGSEDDDVLPVADVRLELGEVPLTIGESFVERDVAEIERIGLRHALQCITQDCVTQYCVMQPCVIRPVPMRPAAAPPRART